MNSSSSCSGPIRAARALDLEGEQLGHLEVGRVRDGVDGSRGDGTRAQRGRHRHGRSAQTAAMSIPVARLNHAVLYVRDATTAAAFYGECSGSRSSRARSAAGPCSCARASGDNHHDLGLFSVGPEAPRPPRGAAGLYHLAWEVPTIEDLAAAARGPVRGRRAGRCVAITA